jgi:hypothetical protein
MQLLLCKVCEYAFQNQNGRHSMIGLFENIVLPQPGVEHPPFFVCLQLEFDPDEQDKPLNLEVVMIDPDGKRMLDFTAEGRVPRDTAGGITRLFMQFYVPKVRFEVLGDYRFDVMMDGKSIGSERLPVLVAAQMPKAP